MATIKKIILLIFILSLVLFLVLSFWPFIMNKIIVPISAVIWISLRIFILSIGQKYYWGAFTFGIMVLIFWLFFQEEPSTEPDKKPGQMIRFKDFESWQNNFSISSNSLSEQHFIKNQLIQLLTSMYAAEQKDKSQFMILDAIKEKAIPLPDPIYGFLFPEVLEENQRSIKQTLKNIWQMPSNWIKQKRIGETRAMETHRMVTEVLIFLENSLEINHDN